VAIDDELEKSALAAEIRDESERTVQEMFVKSGMAGTISLIPLGVGSAINEMLTQLAVRRTYQRMAELFDEMAKQIRDLGEEKINREWFRSEEFQTLLFEALHQLHVTQDKQKIEMLGRALANSGAKEFREESQKELFLQLIRDLTAQHIAMLHELAPPSLKAEPGSSPSPEELWSWDERPDRMGYGPDLLILQTLAANGLVVENLKSEAIREPAIGPSSSQSEIVKAVRNFIKDVQKPPLRYFCLSDLGVNFLKFVGLRES
jgi:hypothetical protein